jgi:hypothetical protein
MFEYSDIRMAHWRTETHEWNGKKAVKLKKPRDLEYRHVHNETVHDLGELYDLLKYAGERAGVQQGGELVVSFKLKGVW